MARKKVVEEVVTPEVTVEETPVVEKKKSAKKTTIEGTVVNCELLNIRKEPNLDAEKLGLIGKGAKVSVAEVLDNGWLLLNGGGYVHGDFVYLPK